MLGQVGVVAGTEPADTTGAPTGERESAGAEPEPLEVLGPVPGVSHWHAAYVVRICNDVLEPFPDGYDSDGVHTHDDGLIHIHPYEADAGYGNARLGRFLDSVGIELATGELTLPLGGTWRDGDQCDGIPSRVFVDRWSGPGPTGELERIFVDPDQIRFQADREVYQIAFAPPDSPPVVPPTVDRLDEVSALPQDPGFRVAVPDRAEGLTIWLVAEVTETPCQLPQVADDPAVGDPVCHRPDGPKFPIEDMIDRAEAAVLNRLPVVALEPTVEALAWLNSSVPADRIPVLAVEADGVVVAVFRVQYPLGTGDRLVITDGLNADSAQALAALLNS